MLNHIPDSIELVDYIDDGEQARHFRFRLLPADKQPNKNQPKKHAKNHRHEWQNVQPGQFFMLNVPSVGEAPFTFTEPPNKQGEFRAFIRQMGQLTASLFTMQPGDILGARGPYGRGWPLNTINNNTLIVAGGCGLAPLVTLIDTLINKQKHEQQLVLVYGARNKAAQLLTAERARWHKQIKIFNTLDEYDASSDALPLSSAQSSSIATIQGSPLTILPKAISAFTSPPTTALLCGPEVMMKSVATYLTEHGMASSSIFLALERRMHCALGLCGHCYINNHYVCKSGPTFSWQEFQQLVTD